MIALRMGPLAGREYQVACSGLRWLCEDGYACRANEVIAFCNISIARHGVARDDDPPFAEEARDLQVGFASRIAGRVRRSPASSRGGFLDQLPYFQGWSPDFVIAQIEPAPGSAIPRDAGDARLLIGCGRRVTGQAEVRNGLFTGWHDRSRAWWAESDERFGTLLSLGICEQVGIVRGERYTFSELFEATRGPAQVVFVPDDALVPCAPLLTEQLQRDRAQDEAITADMMRALAAASPAAQPRDWIFAGALASAMRKSPFTDRYDVVTRHAFRRDVTCDAVLLSLHAETDAVLRHRRLGYALKCHRYRIDETSPAVRAWLQAEFEPVLRTPEEIHRDYLRLIDAVRARAPMQFLIMNAMSTSGLESIYSYAPYDRPLRNALATIRAKELNLMLHDLARERDVAIVDIDAIAADIGGGMHLPDGVHASGALQSEARAEILRILTARGVPGFAPAMAPRVAGAAVAAR